MNACLSLCARFGDRREIKGKQAAAFSRHHCSLQLWCQALQRFSLNLGINAIRLKLHFREGIKLLTNASRGLGQQWRKQIETRPSLLVPVLLGLLTAVSWRCGDPTRSTGCSAVQTQTQSPKTWARRSCSH